MSDVPKEPVEVLSIGSIVGGSIPANRPWRDAVRALMCEVAELRGMVSSPVNVNVVFQVPGDILRPDFAGVRTGHYSRQLRLLLVQVALPEAIPEVPRDLLLELLVQAIDAAEQWAKKRRLAENLESLRGITAALQES